MNREHVYNSINCKRARVGDYKKDDGAIPEKIAVPDVSGAAFLRFAVFSH